MAGEGQSDVDARASELDEDSAVNTETADPLRWWERLGSLIVGLLGVAFGSLAVFRTTNQAGSAALIIVGAAFVLVGVQGTPLLTVSTTAVTLDRRRRAQRVLDRAIQIALEDPATAKEIAVSAAMVAPELVGLPPAFALIYETELGEALQRILTDVQIDRDVRSEEQPDQRADFLVRWPGWTLAIEAVHKRRESVGFRELKRAINSMRLTGADGALLVCNLPIPNVVTDRAEAFARAGVNIGIVRWVDRDDDSALADAIGRAKSRS